jgi:hypothetical protein
MRPGGSRRPGRARAARERTTSRFLSDFSSRLFPKASNKEFNDVDKSLKMAAPEVIGIAQTGARPRRANAETSPASIAIRPLLPPPFLSLSLSFSLCLSLFPSAFLFVPFCSVRFVRPRRNICGSTKAAARTGDKRDVTFGR